MEKNQIEENTQGDPIIVHDEQGNELKPTLSRVPGEENVVDWYSKDDPDRSINWPDRRKYANIAVISSITFLTPLASSMVAPGVPLIMKEFHSTDQTIASFIVSIYILGYAIGPLFLAPLSELYGRLWVYHVNNVLFIIWNIASAVAPNIGALMVFRLLAGIAGSCPITIGGGSIADMIVQEKRGASMAVFALGPLLGPCIGPVAGSFLSQAAGWRWIFWLLAIAVSPMVISIETYANSFQGGVLSTFALFFLRETFDPVLLQRRVNKLRKETGNMQLRSKLDKGISKKEHFKRAIVRPTKMLLFSPIVLVLSIYMAVVYGYLYLLFTTLTEVFEGQYGFSQGTVGLTFLGIGVGSLLGLFTFGLVSDKLVKRMSAKGEMKPEYRLPPLIPGSLVIPIGLFWYGWTAQTHQHWILPIIGTMWVGLGLLATFMPIQTYMVDAFTIYAASAIAANTVLRSLVGGTYSFYGIDSSIRG